MQTGRMITLYGINGIGKTTQTEKLVEFLRTRGKQASRLKYPIYDQEPEGPFINRYLREPGFREANPRTTEELQALYAENRRRYEPTLRERLQAGEWIVAEDYTGTGIAWGLTWGADLEYLESINQDLLRPDLALLMHGERFLSGIETTHRNESNDERVRLCKNFHRLLADRYTWPLIDANRPVEAVHADIVAVVKKML